MSSDPRYEEKRAWAKSHPDSVRASNVKQYRKNRTARLEYCKRYVEEHKEAVRERMLEYHRRTYPLRRARILEQTGKYSRSHPEIRAKIARNYKRNHPDKWRAQNRANNSRRKAAVRGGVIKHGEVVNAIIRSWRLDPFFECSYCHKTFETKTSLHIDHIIPICKGGEHSPGNICRSCPKCNCSKNGKLLL